MLVRRMGWKQAANMAHAELHHMLVASSRADHEKMLSKAEARLACLSHEKRGKVVHRGEEGEGRLDSGRREVGSQAKPLTVPYFTLSDHLDFTHVQLSKTSAMLGLTRIGPVHGKDKLQPA